jgi:hypothetical protein
MCTIKKETQAVFVASKECGLDMNVEKTCMCMCLMNTIQDKSTTWICDKAFESVAKFKYQGIMAEFQYLETTITNQNCIHKDINPFQSNFSANHILSSSYLFCAVKRLVDYL